MNIEVKIDNVSVDLRTIVCSDLKYGQPCKSPRGFNVTLSKEYFLEHFEHSYDSFVRQCAEDDEILDYPDILDLYKLSYPLLRESLYSHKDLVSLILVEYLNIEFFNCFFNASDRGLWRFSITDMESVNIYNDFIFINGVGRDIEQL